MNSADGTIHFNLSFSQNSVYLRVRLRERFVNPQLLKQLAVYKIKEQIINNAHSVYNHKLTNDGKSKLSQRCNDFRLLEEKCREFKIK